MIETGIRFGELHSYHDLNLILAKAEIPAATPKTTYIDVPGADGSLDLSEAHGEIKYKERDCKFTFTVSPSDELPFEEKKTQILNALSGKRFRITLDKDSAYYFTGRCTVSDYKQNGKLAQLVITAKCSPYKFKQEETTAIFALSTEEKTVTVTNGRKSVVPVITCTDDNTLVTFGNNTYTLNAGAYKVLDICFVEGENTMKISGMGTITFTYQEGDL